MIEGTYPIKPTSFPAVPGSEGVGIVTQSHSSSLPVNSLVLPRYPKLGLWTTEEYIAGDESDLIGVPTTMSHLSPLVLSQLAVNPSTALRMLRDFVPVGSRPSSSHDIVIQNLPFSGVGVCVSQMCRAWGVPCVSLARRGDRTDLEWKNYKVSE